MKLINQVKILKAHGFRFQGIGGWRRKVVRFETPEGRAFDLNKSDTRAKLESRIQLALLKDAQGLRWKRERVVYNRRKAMKCIQGGAPWFKRGDYKAKLTLVQGEAA